MGSADSLVDANAEEGARRVALGYLDRASTAAAALEGDPRGGDDDSALHAFRVGMRKLSSCLVAYEAVFGDAVPKKLEKRLRRVAGATSPGRDAEVLHAWVRRLSEGAAEDERPGIERLAERTARERDAAYEDARGASVARFAKLEGKLRDALSTYTMTFEVGRSRETKRFGEAVAEAALTQLEALGETLRRVRGLEDQAIAHEARIHGKRLRYVLEPVRAELSAARATVKQLVALQDLLGDMNDLANLQRLAGRAIEAVALERAYQLREAAERGALSEALAADPSAGLLGILSRASEVRAALLARLLEEWLPEGGALARLEAEVHAVAAHLRGEHGVEIERKYLLSAVPPECRAHPATDLDQGYVPGRALIERVRRTRRGPEVHLVRTVKLGEGMRRIEIEEECAPAVFEGLWALTAGRRVRKRRYAVPHDGLVWEVDEFLDRPLVLAEVELPREDTEVAMPPWIERCLVREVTDEPAYLNVHLAR